MPSQLNILGPPEASSAATTGAGARGGGQEKRRWLAGCRRGLAPHAPSGRRGPGDGLAGLAPLQRPPARAASRYATRAGGFSQQTVPAGGCERPLLLAASAERRRWKTPPFTPPAPGVGMPRRQGGRGGRRRRRQPAAGGV